MSRRDDRVSIRQMLDHARDAIQFAGGKSSSEIEGDRLLSLAIVRLLEVMGEAANRVTPATRNRFPDVPWRTATNLRNRLIHGYDVVDYDIVVDIIENDLPALIERLEQILASIES